MCHHSRCQVVYPDKKHQRCKPGSLRHSSSHRDPVRKIPVEGYLLIFVADERADPFNNDVWQLQSSKFVDDEVVVNVVKCFCIVHKEHLD